MHESRLRLFLYRTLAKPDNLMPHLRKYVLPYILIIVYDNKCAYQRCEVRCGLCVCHQWRSPLGTHVASVPECILAKLPFSPASPNLLPFQYWKSRCECRYHRSSSREHIKNHKESSGFCFHYCYMHKRLFNHSSQLPGPKTVSMRHRTSTRIPESSFFDCRFGLNLS